VSNLSLLSLGRSHRSKLGKGRLRFAIDETRRILGVPESYLVGIVPASDTGAYEMAMWNMLGARDVDVCHWESFGKGWFQDAVSHLKLGEMGVDVREHTADYGCLPDLTRTSPDRDVLFTFNGTTSGVRVPDGCDWISDDRTGLTMCDATSAAFAMDMPWDKLDVTTYSWQKVLGGEGAHGMLILSPRAVERLETYVPPGRPLPKIFRMTKGGKVDASIFEGATINTPSMMCVEDYIDALAWAESVGGKDGLIKLSNANLAVIERFVEENDFIDFLAKDKSIRSNTSVCCTLDLTPAQIKSFVALLEKENVALDIGGYRDAPPSIRIWCGATVETADVEALMPWLRWAYDEVRKA
jgi:phosphoserine aminotransferase